MVKSLHSSKNQRKPSKTDEKLIYNLKQKTGIKKSPKKPKTLERNSNTLLLKKAAALKQNNRVSDDRYYKVKHSNASVVSDARHLRFQHETLQKSETKQYEYRAKRSNAKDELQVKNEATTKTVLKKEELPPEIHNSAEKRTKTPISLEALKYVRHFLESSLSKECVNFLYNLKLDFVYEDVCLKADYESGLACKFLYILQSKGFAEYIKRERKEEKARFDFLWIIKSDEILRKARLFYIDQLREIDKILDMMTLQEVYVDSVAEKYYTFDEAVERNFVSEGGVELKPCDSRELLIKKHKLEKIINSLTDVQITSLRSS